MKVWTINGSLYEMMEGAEDEMVDQCFLDSSRKDTVLVWPGERVRVAMTFTPYSGMYMYHYHILEHEDMTMKRNYMIMDHMMPMM
jgi:FtsP/CotA-like multicopper oxidase with cupredoxin domain